MPCYSRHGIGVLASLVAGVVHTSCRAACIIPLAVTEESRTIPHMLQLVLQYSTHMVLLCLL
jgi:hypothetical protein